jgi:hypothetical protein
MPRKKKENNEPINIAQAQNTLAPSFAAWGISEERTGSGTMTRTRRGKTLLTSVPLTDKYTFINELPLPFIRFSYGANNYISIRETLQLIEKAYFGFALFRNVVETFVELSNTDIYLKGGNKESRTFISKWLERVGIWNVADQWYRDYFWKANVFPYRRDANFSDADIKQLQMIYGSKAKISGLKQIPIDYTFLAPEDLVTQVGWNYGGQFYKVMSPAEIQRVANPKTDEDKQFAEQFTPEERKMAQQGSLQYQAIDPERLYYSTYKRQSYYPFGVPFGFSVLADINFKLLLNKLDEEIAKTLDLALLHIAVGDEKTGIINNNNISTLQQMFGNPKLQRVLVTDYTVKLEWKIPQIDTLLGPTKHEEINRRLKEGLFSAIFGEAEKFASLSVKGKVLVEKLEEARRGFLNDFLQPEIKRVSQIMGFKNFPRAYAKDISLEDEVTLRRIYGRLAEIGFLTPQETFQAIQEGILPLPEESLENQEEFKAQKAKGLWVPAANPPSQFVKSAPKPPMIGGVTGRPAGTGTPQTTKKTKPIGSKGSFSMAKILEKVVALGELEKLVYPQVCKIAALQETDETGKRLAKTISLSLAVNRDIKEWNSSIEEFIRNPKLNEIDEKVKAEIFEIEQELGVDNEQATILFLSNRE